MNNWKTNTLKQPLLQLLLFLLLGLSCYKGYQAAEQLVTPQVGKPWMMGETGLEMVWISSSSGTGKNEAVKGFWMGKYPVLQSEFEKVMGYNLSFFMDGSGKLPVERLSWKEARDFCEKLTKMAIEKGFIETGWHFELPTREQWLLGYGKRESDSLVPTSGQNDPTQREGWFVEDSNGTTHPVGLKVARPSGCYDMLGNVWEWTLSDPVSVASQSDTDQTSQTKPEEPKCVLGGAWSTRYPSRSVSIPEQMVSSMDRLSDLGFRVVLLPVLEEK